MNQLVENLKSLGRTRLITMGAVGFGLVIMLVFGLSIITAPAFKPLFTGLSPSGASGVVSSLEQAGFQVRISSDGAVVSVPQEDLARARMTLAERGMPMDGAPGWELFDNQSGLGMNTFMQRINRLRAMEGELARSIQTIDGVEAARVHLVLPEREAFSRTRTEASASVIIRTGPTYDLGRKQALAIRNLVSSAVANLSANKVTVLSASGETILAEDSNGSISEITLQSTKAAIEDRMAKNIEAILTARVGAGNARVQVAVKLNSERKVMVSEVFDPDQQVVRSSETREERIDGREIQAPGVGVESNFPEALADSGAGGAGSSNSKTRTDEVVNFEIGSTRSETVIEPGEVMKISIAVLINGIYEVLPNGDTEYQQRSPEELVRLQTLVQSAIGFDASRGDQVSIDSLRFIDYSLDVGEPVGISVMQVLAENVMSIIRWIFAMLIVALVMILGVRPALQRAFPDAADIQANLDKDANEPAATEAANGAANGALQGRGNNITDPASEIEPEDMMKNPSAAGGALRQQLDVIGDLVEKEPEATMKILRGWLASEA